MEKHSKIEKKMFQNFKNVGPKIGRYLMYIICTYVYICTYIFFAGSKWLRSIESVFISEKQNNKASPTGARLPKGAMLLRDIPKFTKPSLDAFRPFGLISRACQGPRGPPNSINVGNYKTD